MDAFLLLFSVYTDYSALDRKKQYSFQKPLQFPSTCDRTSQSMMNLLGFIIEFAQTYVLPGEREREEIEDDEEEGGMDYQTAKP